MKACGPWDKGSEGCLKTAKSGLEHLRLTAGLLESEAGSVCICETFCVWVCTRVPGFDSRGNKIVKMYAVSTTTSFSLLLLNCSARPAVPFSTPECSRCWGCKRSFWNVLVLSCHLVAVPCMCVSRPPPALGIRRHSSDLLRFHPYRERHLAFRSSVLLT